MAAACEGIQPAHVYRCGCGYSAGLASLGLCDDGLRPYRIQRWKGDPRAAVRRPLARTQGSGRYALLNNSPYEDTLGRSQKVGKEEIVGMVKALESYLKEDHEALNKEWQRRLEVISAEVNKVRGVTTKFWTPDVANHVPHLDVGWDKQHIALTPEQVATGLRAGKPAIVVASAEHPEVISMNSFMLQPGEERIIADTLSAYLKTHSS